MPLRASPRRRGLLEVRLEPLAPSARDPNEYAIARRRPGVPSGKHPVSGNIHRFICSLPHEGAWRLLGTHFSLIRFLTGMQGATAPPTSRAPYVFQGSESATLEALFLATSLIQLRYEYTHPDVEELVEQSGMKNIFMSTKAHYDAYFRTYSIIAPMAGAFFLELLWTLRMDCLGRPDISNAAPFIRRQIPSPILIQGIEERVVALLAQASIPTPFLIKKASSTDKQASPAIDSDYTTPQSTPPSKPQHDARVPFGVLTPAKASQRRDEAEPYEHIQTWLASSDTAPSGTKENHYIHSNVFVEPPVESIRGRSSTIMPKERAVSPTIQSVSKPSRGFVDDDGARYKRLPDRRSDIPAMSTPPRTSDSEHGHTQHPDIYARLRIKNPRPSIIPIKPDVKHPKPATLTVKTESLKCAGCSSAFLDKEALRLTCKHHICKLCWLIELKCPACDAPLPKAMPDIVKLC